MKKKIKIGLSIVVLGVGLCFGGNVQAQDVPLPPTAGGAAGDKAPATEVPFGTGVDMLILLGGAFAAKIISDKKKQVKG